MTGDVVSLRRYPVKSMGGEPLDRVWIDARGLAGDRWFAVVDDTGHLASGKNSRRFRRRDAVFDYAAATSGADVFVQGNGGRWRVGDPDLDAELSRVMHARVRVASESSTRHHDAGQVSLVGTATLEWCAARWGIDADPRRLRVNLVVETSEPFVEETWQGRRISNGAGTLSVMRRIERCRMIDIDQDGATASGRWLTPLGRERDMSLAMYADVVTPGVLRTGDRLELV